MAHYLTFDSSVTCTVNGTSVSSGYELHDGDVIVAKAGGTGMMFSVNSDWYSNGTTVDVSDSDIALKSAPQSGGGVQ